MGLLYSFRTTPVTLILANLIPLFGVLFLGWKVFFLLALYWAENVIVGIINVGKLVAIRKVNPEVRKPGGETIGFFIVHYGGFAFVHGVFVLAAFGPQGPSSEGLFNSLPEILAQPLFWVAGAILFTHHFINYLDNFLGAGEYLGKTFRRQMFEPYGRVVVLHLVIIFGGFWVQKTGEPIWELVLLVALKIILDLGIHFFSHASNKARA